MEQRRPCDGRGRNWSDGAANQGMPRIVDKHKKQKRGKERFFLTAFMGAWPCQYHDFGFLVSENYDSEHKFLLF